MHWSLPHDETEGQGMRSRGLPSSLSSVSEHRPTQGSVGSVAVIYMGGGTSTFFAKTLKGTIDTCSFSPARTAAAALPSSTCKVNSHALPDGRVSGPPNYRILPCIMRTHGFVRIIRGLLYPCIMHILTFPSKIWAERCALYMAKYGTQK